MDIARTLADLRTERDRLIQAITAIEGLNSSGNHMPRRGRPAKAAKSDPTQRRGRRRMSLAVRRRLSQLAKARWAERKRKAGPKTSAKRAAPARHMSAATRKRLSLLAKRRWAAKKKAAKG